MVLDHGRFALIQLDSIAGEVNRNVHNAYSWCRRAFEEERVGWVFLHEGLTADYTAEPLQHAADWALCIAPPAYEADAHALRHAISFDAPLPAHSSATDGVFLLELHGVAAIAGGVLRLTDLTNGTWSPLPQLCAPQNAAYGSVGSIILTLRRPFRRHE